MAKDIFHDAVKEGLLIPKHAYQSFENMALIWESIETYKVKLIVYSTNQETVLSWKK